VLGVKGNGVRALESVVDDDDAEEVAARVTHRAPGIMGN
jgi:hypothetical protein